MLYCECEKHINKKIVARQIVCWLAVAVLFLGTFFAGHIFTVKKIGQSSFTETRTIEVPSNWENPYKDLMKDEIALYIIEVCKPLKLNPNLVVSIQIQENPSQNPYAINKNENGTVDCGLFQLNSAYLIYFADLYWPFDKWGSDIKFDWSNWQQNAWVAIHLIDDLYESFDGDVEKTITAYNSGVKSVLAGDVPKSTLDYRDRVLKLYTLLNNS